MWLIFYVKTKQRPSCFMLQARKPCQGLAAGIISQARKPSPQEGSLVLNVGQKLRLERRQQLRRDQFLAVQWSGLWTGAPIQPMVGQLRCHKPHHGEKKRKDQWDRRVWERRQVRPDKQKKQKILAFPLPLRLSFNSGEESTWQSKVIVFHQFLHQHGGQRKGRVSGFRQTLLETTVGTGCEGSRAVVCPHSMVSPVSGQTGPHTSQEWTHIK